MNPTIPKTPSRPGRAMNVHSYLAAVEACSNDPIIGVTPQGRVTRWSSAAEKLCGHTLGDIRGKHFSQLILRIRQKEWKHILARMRRGGSARQVETVCVRKDGGEVPASLSAFPTADADGRVTGGVIVIRDITRRLRVRETLLRRNRELLTFHRLSQIVLSPRTLEESYADVVKEIRMATGFPIAAIAIPDDALRKVVFRGLTGLPDRSSLEFPLDDTLAGTVIRSGKPLVESHVLDHPEYRSKVLRRLRAQTFVGFPMKTGRRIIGCLNLLHTESIPVSEETQRWIEGLANYVAALTERKRAEEELRSSREQLRELSRRTRSAIEEERKRIAREIHDELGQELSLAQLELGFIRERLPSTQKDLVKKTKSITKLIDAAIKSVQKISTSLRPTLLDNLGLGAAAEWAVGDFQKRTRIRCRISVDPPDVAVDPERSTALFRILQEALTNVVRHARATKVDVRLALRNDDVQLRVRDNGKGIPAGRIDDPKSAGLAGMRERVLPWEGSVTFNGKPGKGTEVVVTVPLER